MIETIRTSTHVGADGVLSLRLPVGVVNTDVHVTVVVESTRLSSDQTPYDRDAWLKFIAETAGSISDPTFVRPDQGEYEVRDEMF